jgi:hypothetical protein
MDEQELIEKHDCWHAQNNLRPNHRERRVSELAIGQESTCTGRSPMDKCSVWGYNGTVSKEGRFFTVPSKSITSWSLGLLCS